MKDIIKTLMDIDKSAQEIMLQAESETQHKKENLSEEIEKSRESYDLRRENRMEKVREFHAKDVAEKISEIESQYQQKTIKLEETYEKNKDEWAMMLVKKCIE